ncbi:exosortase A [Sphingomonas bacterium]|uniref:exosortase A n=1 Tax=Sphingomonas bacterium TaxID=1895847 RepID=UPI001576E959|nr:exosortase A [Sphingomonas bacterium]
MTVALPVARAAPVASAWRVHLIVLTAVVAGLIATFRADVRSLAHIWWTSTTFGHCLFVGPVVAWLVWNRRRELARLEPVAWAPGLLLVASGGMCWLAGDAAGVTFARHLGLVVMAQGAAVTLLGPKVSRGLCFPIAYTLFLVPFGEGLEEPLQRATVAMVMPLLHAAGIPASVDGVLITIPNGFFEVAEACSGAKFVIAMIAYGALVANVCLVAWPRRAAFMAVALVVPVLANGIRAFATIYVASLTSVERATGYDHIVYGWMFFGLVMAVTLALGWRWFDRAPDDPAFDPLTLDGPVRARLRMPVAALLAVAIAGAFPLWSAALAARPAPLPSRIALPEVPGWTRAPLSVRAPWRPWYPGADHTLFGRYRDAAGEEVDLAIAVFGRQREGAKLLAFGTGVLREEDIWVRIADLSPIDDADGSGGAATRIAAPGPVERVVATWYRVGDTVTADAGRVKIETLKARLLGGAQRAVAIHLSAEAGPGRDPLHAIERFHAALGPLDRLADHDAGLN